MKRFAIPQKAKAAFSKVFKRRTFPTDPAEARAVNVFVDYLRDERKLRNKVVKQMGITAITKLAAVELAPLFIKFKDVREATKHVGQTLGRIARNNVEVRNALKSKKYVIVDGKGNVKLTNVPRLAGIGRIRLSTREILNESAPTKKQNLKVEVAWECED